MGRSGPMNSQKERKVSFDNELLILVDEQDQIIGFKDKLSCHLGSGVLHRAFSIFIFNDEGKLLMQQRSDLKSLWPLFWSNSCCSHPRKGEKMGNAATRRLYEELGIRTDLKFIYKFMYQVPFKDAGSENEYCSVFIGKSNQPANYNINEIAALKYLDPEELDSIIDNNPQELTPWFQLEWEQIRKVHWATIQAYLKG
jgi:isopentenyl-diphosphate delta-isomerase